MADRSLLDPILESWDRTSTILLNIASLITPENRETKPADDSMPIVDHLAHINATRRFWLTRFYKKYSENLGPVMEERDGDYHAIADLEEIKLQLKLSSKAVRDAVEDAILNGNEQPFYSHPIMFFQHMVWHEGWHVGLIMLGLRNAGVDPGEEWEEPNIWGIWRTEVW